MQADWRRSAEVAELELAVEWAVVNGHPRDERDPMVTPGGDGTPAVRDHAIPELAMARETHRVERERSRHERYVRLSRADEFGYRHLIARVTADDAAWIDAMIDRVAEILTLTHGHDHDHDELRSLAVGWLARPVELLKLLLEHTQPDTDATTGEPVQPSWAPDHTTPDRSGGAITAPGPTAASAMLEAPDGVEPYFTPRVIIDQG